MQSVNAVLEGTMKLLHTSDWHLGRTLYGKNRYEEFSAFLNWLTQTIEKEQIDILLVAGDVFDTSTPSNRAQALYYNFLLEVSSSRCRHVVVIAGNHDSPSFLNAPKALLRALNVHVVGAMSEGLEEEVIVLDKDGLPQAIVCAVPYLRDKDIRLVEPGETIDDKNAKLVEGLKNHYSQVSRIAEEKRTEFEKAGHPRLPIVAMGHLFTTGAKTVEGDGVRELYVGSLAHVDSDVFPCSIDYVALGHLHIAQSLGGAEHIRYCGSPIAMGYGEASQDKRVLTIEFNGDAPDITELPVPCFQPLVRIVGSMDDIYTTIEALKKERSRAWLEIEYTGSDIVGRLWEQLEDVLSDCDMEIRRIKNSRVTERIISAVSQDESLENLEPRDVFARCLEAFDVPYDEREDLTASHDEVIRFIHEQDSNAQ